MKNGILKIFCDGGARGNPGPAASSFVVDDEGKIIYSASRFLGKGTNNVAEYQAVIMALRWLKRAPGNYSKVVFYLDSELIKQQLIGEYKVKDKKLKPLFGKVKNLEKEVDKDISYHLLPRNKNRLADFLVNKTLDENS